MMQRTRNPWGLFGRPTKLMEAFSQWRDAVEAGVIELQEADSKADFPSFLFGPVREMLWYGYNFIQPQYRRYARVENAPDFRERRLKGLNRLTNYGYVGDHGQYIAMQRTERPAASLAIDTYGAVYSITRQAIINDDTGELLNRNPTEMGMRAAQFVVRTIIALVESNVNAPDGNPMFSVGRGNQITTPLSEDSIATIMTLMETQVDDNGDPINVGIATIAVQNMRMELILRRIIGSTLAGTQVAYAYGTNWPTTAASGAAASATFDKGTMNPLQGILPAEAIVRDPYWTDANDYYVFADPNQIPGFAVAFLNGNEQPFVGLRDPAVRNALGPGTDPYSFDLDSVDFKVRHDFGAAAVDPRGVFRGVVA